MPTTGKIIRVLIVDDSLFFRTSLERALKKNSNIEIAGLAVDADDALEKIRRLRPDVVSLDVEMPKMNGIDFLKKLLPIYRVPVVVVSAAPVKVFDALSAGAVDFVRKPEPQDNKDVFITALSQKVIIASMARVRAPSAAAAAAVKQPLAAPSALGPSSALDHVIVGLGASTGGTEATLEVMKRLPADIPAMVIVQHMPKGFTQMYAERLNRLCKMEVREAKNGDELHRGLALVAPADLQCRVVRIGEKYTVSCTPGEKVSGHRPSVDALFQSMSEVVRCKMVGIIMTGMGQDGAAGLLAMRKKGAYTIGQDKESSVVYGMPMVAHDIGAVCIQASCENVANVLLRHLKTLG